jgi:hypothetical protein
MGERGMNDFQECLDKSHATEDLPLWRDIYEQAFPGVASIVSHRKDGYWQRAGVDRSVILETSKQILIDEKARGRNKRTGVVYKDIALEYISNDRTESPGWVCKPLMCDYIAYAILPHGICYLLPVLQLQLAWLKNKNVWLEEHKPKYAQNKTYKTWFCPVPHEVLYPAIGGGLRVSFEPHEYDE